jgi:RNA polymerase sigma-70 factor (ECF subfamily)
MQPFGRTQEHTGMPLIPPASGEAHEAALLARIARQDRRALEELYHGYHRRLSRFLLRLAPRFDLAEEIINDTFWVVWRKAAEFRGASRVSTWIMGIAYRRALRALRTARQHDSARFEPLREDVQLVDDAATGDNEDWIAQGLGTLPEEQRLALELAYFLGHSCEEIAAITEVPVGTVKARMFHAREKLRVALPRLGGLMERVP